VQRSTLVLGLLLAAAGADGGAATGPAPASTEIRIELPDPANGGWSVLPGGGRLVLELPRGASFPPDIGASTAGFVRDAEVAAIDGGGHRVTLALDAADLARVETRGSTLVLTLTRHPAPDAIEPSGSAYLLGTADKIALTVHNHPELSATLTVDDSGTVIVPLVGEVQAAGLSTAQLAAGLTERLGRDYLVDPHVDVAVVEYWSQWVMVAGEVKSPGRVPLRGGTRLKEVLSDAGGFLETGGPQIVITRRGEDTDEMTRMVIERRAFEAGAENPVLRPGDIVDVPRTAFCYVQGEVRQPNRIPIERGTTLLRALSLVGGLTEWADKKAVTIRYGDGRVAEVNLKRVVAGRIEDPVLMGDEVIVVRRRFF
jgi:polysaccharide export outer membrane protein